MGKVAQNDPSVWTAVTRAGDLEKALGSWLQPGPVAHMACFVNPWSTV